MKKTYLTIVLTALLAACSTTPTSAPVAEQTPQSAAQPAVVAAAQPIVNGNVSAGLYPAKGVGGALGDRSVFYDFDNYTVKDQYRPMVDAHGGFLLGNKAAKATLQGNCDERGSREYNLALGQRRADSVRKILVAKGVSDNQIETISFGKEKPRNPGHDAAAWGENRRTDIVYQGE